MDQVQDLPVSPIPAVNVACVPQRSPLRYPGGKTWLIPHIRFWLGRIEPRPRELIEPFAGGAIVSLTAVMENLVQRAVMAEIDQDVAAFWDAALHHNSELRRWVREFKPTRDSVGQLSSLEADSMAPWGFRTLVLNRTRRGGILADGASLARSGENGKGLLSRWYPDTIVRRLQDISYHSDRIEFLHSDGLDVLESRLCSGGSGTVVFADPPYTAGGKQAGKRLYNSHMIDHQRLFSILANSRADFLMTYDKAPEILSLIETHQFQAVEVQMRNTHHSKVSELVITRSPVFVA